MTFLGVPLDDEQGPAPLLPLTYPYPLSHCRYLLVLTLGVPLDDEQGATPLQPDL